MVQTATTVLLISLPLTHTNHPSCNRNSTRNTFLKHKRNSSRLYKCINSKWYMVYFFLVSFKSRYFRIDDTPVPIRYSGELFRSGRKSRTELLVSTRNGNFTYSLPALLYSDGSLIKRTLPTSFLSNRNQPTYTTLDGQAAEDLLGDGQNFPPTRDVIRFEFFRHIST